MRKRRTQKESASWQARLKGIREIQETYSVAILETQPILDSK